MNASDAIRNMERRVHSHAYEDGIAEMLLGALLALAAAIIAGGRTFLLPLALFALVPTLRRLRDRYSTPRIGFAEPTPQPPVRFVAGLAAYGVFSICVSAALMMAAGDLFDAQRWYRWIPAFAGLMVAGGFLHASSTSGLRRFAVYATVAIAGGVVLALGTEDVSRANGYAQLRLLLSALAVVVFGTGSAVFVRFLRRHPVDRRA